LSKRKQIGRLIAEQQELTEQPLLCGGHALVVADILAAMALPK